MRTSTILLLPGLGNSGPTHWQSLWEQENPSYRRVVQADWNHPSCAEWIETLNAFIEASAPPVILVAHSLACALVANWFVHFPAQTRVKGALLVSPSDVDSPVHTPPEVRSFSPIGLTRFNFASIVVISITDPYVDIARAKCFAAAWGSRLVNIGDAGHINAASGLGSWPAGKKLLNELILNA